MPCSAPQPRSILVSGCSCLAQAPRPRCALTLAPERPARVHAGELCDLQPPPQPRSCPRASSNLSRATSGSRAPRRSSPAQSPLKSQPRGPSSASSGAAPPRERVSGGQRRRFPATSALSRPIKNGRARLDRIPIRSEPLDLDPTAHTRRYRCGLANLLKRPWVSFK